MQGQQRFLKVIRGPPLLGEEKIGSRPSNKKSGFNAKGGKTDWRSNGTFDFIRSPRTLAEMGQSDPVS